MTIEVVDRHVQGVDEERVPLDHDGFLDLGGGTGITLAKDLAEMSGSFVILASGGVGKSVVLDDLRRREAGVEVDLVALDAGDVGRVVSEAVASGRPVYMDSLDEALALEPTLFRVLTRAMSKPEAREVRWRLACRPSAWTSTLAEGAKSFEKLRLLPLTRDAARHLLASLDVGEGFLDVVAASGQSRLNGSLLHFIAAARQWQQEGRLPRQRADALESEIQRLLAEREDIRQPLRTAADVRRRTAGRLAAFSAFSGVSRFAFRTTASQSTSAIADLPSQPEPDRPDATIGREVYEEVLGSALFDTAPKDTVSFRHQEYVDYLAAKYVADWNPVRAQVTALLGMTEGVVPRSMASAAGWLVALRPDLASMVASANAITLVESEVELPPTARATVVAALLTDAKAPEASPMWSLDLTVVVHPELERQLADRVAAGVESAAEVWWICRLALAGRIAPIAPAALTMALDDRWPSWARRPAIAVVTELGAEAERSALLSGLVINEDADPDDELRAGLLDGLYPQHMTTTQLLPFVIQPRRRIFLGAYRKFLMEFAARVPDADLPEVLNWARENNRQHISFESRQWSDDVSIRVVERALASSESPTVLEPLADLVVTLLRHTRADVPWAHDATRRRRLALAVAARLDDREWPLLLRSGLVIADDVAWLIDAVGEDRPTGNGVLAECLGHLLAQAVQALTPPDADEDDEEENLDQADRGPDRAEVQAAIVAARQDLTSWCDVPMALARDSCPEPLFSCDLTERPGWSLLEADEQQEVLDQGLQYVIQHSPTPSMWLGKTSVGLEVIRDWSGVYLLTTLARHAPTRLRAIPTPTWLRWAPAIANAFTHDHRYLVNDLVDLAPSEAKAEILTAVRAALDARGEWRPTLLHKYFAKELAPELATALQQRRYPDAQNVDLLAFLIEHSPDLATDTCRAVATDDGSALSRAANRYLASIDTNGAIDRLLREPVPHDTFLERIEGITLDKVDDGRLAAFAGLLFDQLPFTSDPPWTEGWSASPELDGTRLRNHTVDGLAARGLVRDLKLLARGRPPVEQAFIRHHLRHARQVAADNAQVRPVPADLLALLGRSHLRLIRNSSDLVDVLEDHFGELQHDLSRSGRFRDLWSPDGKKLGSEDDITDWVRHRLTDRLGKDCLIIGRESQVERLKVKGLGTRIDLTTSAPTLTAPVGTANVIIEAKLVGNDELLTALRDQLVQRYLAATGQRHGIYLVYWVPPEQRTPGSRKVYSDKNDLLEDLRRLSAEVAPRYAVRPYVLDVSWPSSPQ